MILSSIVANRQFAHRRQISSDCVQLALARQNAKEQCLFLGRRPAVPDLRRSGWIGLQPDSIIDCITESLLAPQVPFCRLDRNVS